MKLDLIVLRGRIAQVLCFRNINLTAKNTIRNIRYKWNSLDITIKNKKRS